MCIKIRLIQKYEESMGSSAIILRQSEQKIAFFFRIRLQDLTILYTNVHTQNTCRLFQNISKISQYEYTL
jgi:hypothetical protein